MDLNGSHVEAAEIEVMFIDDAETGEQVYSLDDVAQGEPATADSASSP